MTALSWSLKDRSTAFLIHWWVVQPVAPFSATLRRPAASSGVTGAPAPRKGPPAGAGGVGGGGGERGAVLPRAVDNGLQCGHDGPCHRVLEKSAMRAIASTHSA